VTVAVEEFVPPGPVHDNVNEESAVSAAVTSEPLVAFAPLQPPEAVQEVAFDEVQVSVVVAPEATLVGLAVSVTLGGGVAGGLGPPPPPPPPHAAMTAEQPASATMRAKRGKDCNIIDLSGDVR
jgi:hypothetical protein